MRINTSGKKEYRTDLYERTADALNENTKTGAIDRACIHVEQDISAKQDTIEFLSEVLAPQDLKQVAKLLSTDAVQIDVDVTTEITVE